KVLDFGVAKAREATQAATPSSLKGHYAYMAPEQVRGEPLDRRADVFALGVILFELATGKRLFRRDSDFHTFRAITEEPLPEIVCPSPELSAVIGRALERDRERRFASARALAEALHGVVAPLGGVLPGAALADRVRMLVGAELDKRRALVAGALQL